MKDPGFVRSTGLKQACKIFSGTSEYPTNSNVVPELTHFIGRTEIFTVMAGSAFKIIKPPGVCLDYKQCEGYALLTDTEPFPPTLVVTIKPNTYDELTVTSTDTSND
jgi:hypothetical protein